MDYALPKAEFFPPFELDRTETLTDVNPLGVKGAGETGTIASTPAVVNAVVDALAPLGIAHIDMPLTPERVWRAIEQAKAEEEARMYTTRPAEFTYHRPTSVDDAVALLAELEDSRPLAGGHSLLPAMKLRFSIPSALVDIGRIAELGGDRGRRRRRPHRRDGDARRRSRRPSSCSSSCPALAEAASHHRRPPGAQPRHDRRQPRPRRSRRRLPDRGDGARRDDHGRRAAAARARSPPATSSPASSRPRSSRASCVDVGARARRRRPGRAAPTSSTSTRPRATRSSASPRSSRSTGGSCTQAKLVVGGVTRRSGRRAGRARSSAAPARRTRSPPRRPRFPARWRT